MRLEKNESFRGVIRSVAHAHHPKGSVLELVHLFRVFEVWVHDPGCLHDPSAHAHNDVVENAHAQMTILFCDDLRHCTICSTLAHLSLLSSVNTIEGIIFLI